MEHDFIELITEAGRSDGSPSVATCRRCGLVKLTTPTHVVFYFVRIDEQFAICNSAYRGMTKRLESTFPVEYMDFLQRTVGEVPEIKMKEFLPDSRGGSNEPSK